MSDVTDVPYLAPGCFGSALMFRDDDMVCNACPFKEQCEPAHQHALSELRRTLGIVPPKAKKVAQKPEVVTAGERHPERTVLPKKVQELLARIDRGSFDIVGSMKRGENPFVGRKGFGFMAVACHLVIRLKRPVTREIISYALMKRNNWTKGTADAHARMAIQALEHVGAIKNTDGILTVAK